MTTVTTTVPVIDINIEETAMSLHLQVQMKKILMPTVPGMNTLSSKPDINSSFSMPHGFTPEMISLILTSMNTSVQLRGSRTTRISHRVN